MPLYNYKCEKCGTEFEDLVPIDERNKPRYCEGKDDAPCGGIANRVYNEIPANMAHNWASWNTQAGALKSIQKRAKGSVSDKVAKRHSGSKEVPRKVKDKVRKQTSRLLNPRPKPL